MTSSRRRTLVATAVAGALVATGGAAWAVWRLGGGGSSATTASRALDLRLTAIPRPDAPLYPGARTDLAVTVENPNPFPVTLTTVHAGSEPITVDAAHRAAGCITTGVSPTRGLSAVSLSVGPRSSASFLLLDAIQMTNDSDSACQGATFTVPLTASGRSGAN
ncbi:hypothetical protein AB0G04_02885 [Actinoplanes sp. NPDC023801]|uniref:hypothetical protein n=1 Tax=Actinoplanes sp. NPDC023801 TaxID=3154595 RepID=UPI0033C3B841